MITKEDKDAFQLNLATINDELKNVMRVATLLHNMSMDKPAKSLDNSMCAIEDAVERLTAAYQNIILREAKPLVIVGNLDTFPYERAKFHRHPMPEPTDASD